MTADLAPFLETRRWTQGGRVAPYKPLVLLIALSALRRGGTRIGYLEAEPLFDRLRDSHAPDWTGGIDNPFGRLARDADGTLWTLFHDPMVDVFTASGAIVRQAALRAGLEGGFPAPWLARFRERPALAGELAQRIARQGFGARADALLTDLALS
jgi:hypothetical protein